MKIPRSATVLTMVLGMTFAGCGNTSETGELSATTVESPATTDAVDSSTTTTTTPDSSSTTTSTISTSSTTTSATTTSTSTTITTPETTMEKPWSVPIAGEVGEGDFPSLLISNDGVINRNSGGRTVGLVNLPHDTGDVSGADGWVVTERLESSDQGETVTQLLASHEGSNFDPLQFPKGVEPRLLDVETIDGEPRILVHLYNPNTDGDTTGRIVLVDPTGETDPVEVTVGAAPEYFVTAGSMTQDLIALSAFADLTEVISFVTLDGEEVDRTSPTDDLPYGQAPLISEAALANDGTSMAYLSGPDHGPEGLSDDPLELVVVTADGDEVYRQVLAENAGDLTAELDFDGRWAVISLTQAKNPIPPILLDTTADEPVGYLVAPGGFASLEG